MLPLPLLEPKRDMPSLILGNLLIDFIGDLLVFPWAKWPNPDPSVPDWGWWGQIQIHFHAREAVYLLEASSLQKVLSLLVAFANPYCALVHSTPFPALCSTSIL